MRAIVQRVKEASVTIDNKEYSKIKRGLLVFLGVGNNDNKSDLDYISKKISNMRIFSDENGKMNLSIKDIDGEILLVSQFTLYGDIRKGNRPSFTDSANPEIANQLYESLAKDLEQNSIAVKTGVFAADMQVSLINDGPVTIQLDSSKIY